MIYGFSLLFLLIVLSLALGSSDLDLADLYRSLIFHAGWSSQLDESMLVKDSILWSIRLPRILMAALSGAGLSLVGATIQALLRNPMADPWLLGVSSGASLGAVTAIVFGLHLLDGFSVTGMAFVGAVLAAALIYGLARRQQIAGTHRLIFTGLAISFCFEALTQILIFTSDRHSQIQNVLFWTMGSLGGVENTDLPIPAIAVAMAFIGLYRWRDTLNILCLSELKAYSLGLDLTRTRRTLFLLAAAVTSVLVSVTGPIGFVGLMIPHLVRMLIGNDYRQLIPACFFGGAAFMVIADVLARSIFSPREIPIGVLTALLGAPFFIWLMGRQDA